MLPKRIAVNFWHKQRIFLPNPMLEKSAKDQDLTEPYLKLWIKMVWHCG